MKKRNPLLTGALLGAVSSIAFIGIMYFGEQLAGLPFLPFDIFDWMARVMPGDLIRFVIRIMLSIITFFGLEDSSTVAKIAEQIIAIIQLIAGGAIFGLVLAVLKNAGRKDTTTNGIVGGLILLALTLVIEQSLGFPGAGFTASALWLAVLFSSWGWILGWMIEKAGAQTEAKLEAELSRRQFLSVSFAGMLAVALGTLGLGYMLQDEDYEEVTRSPISPKDDPWSASFTNGEAASPSPAELATRSEPAKGTRDELTATDDFYRIDINSRSPKVSGSNWKLNIFGLVDKPRELSIEELIAFPSVSQILTMQCISNRIGGDLTGTTRWTGARLMDVLEEVGMQRTAGAISIKSTDGFHESVEMKDIIDKRTLLVYDMDGLPLTKEHGFPLRIYIPNRYGMKQPKWIESIEAVPSVEIGYWVKRGWSNDAFVNTVSVVDTVAVDMMTGSENAKTVAVGGMAWAGSRGIGIVEIQVDDEDWVKAELITPALSPLSWVLWRYDWNYSSGRHTFHVRAYDSDGNLQETEDNPPSPNGATGIHSLSVRV